MKSIIRAAVLSLAILPVVSYGAQAQDRVTPPAAPISASGDWAGALPSNDGNDAPQVMMALTADQDQGTVTGSIIVVGTPTLELSVQAGTIAGDLLQFKTTQKDGESEVTFNWTGTVRADQIAFSRAPDSDHYAAQEFVVKRK